MANVILEKIAKHYPGNDKPTVNDLNLSINDGEFMVFVGPSGCGKSTVLRMIAGLINTTSGKMLINGKDITDLPPKDRGISMVFQNYALFPHLDVYENISFGLSIRKTDKKEIDKRVNDAAELLGITDFLRKKPKNLSGGQRQRVAVGRAIVRRPKVFLFDEPLSNLDAKMRTQMRVEISKLHKKLKTTIIYVTHDQCEAMTMADRMVVLNNGIIQQCGAPSEIYSSPKNIFVATFIGSPPMNLFKGEIIREDDRLFFKINNTALMLPLKFSGALKDETCDYTLGIRPEHIYLDERKSDDMTFSEAIDCEIELAESMGNDVSLHCKAQGLEFQSNQRHDFPIKTGDRIKLVFAIDKLHLFDKNGDSVL
ncbi:MAG: sn-glycerol-3-phosphate ABC transporter ATP-binding protein UgpC [Elusimicrobia bacterium]|nr:sn-glycerol-3-phosphate ABC transporter ATP-binding protein UgpC [Elusimicrobiota bacterium]